MAHGVYWHVYGDFIAEFCYDATGPHGRIETIKICSRPGQRSTFLRLFKPIVSCLPKDIQQAADACWEQHTIAQETWMRHGANTMPYSPEYRDARRKYSDAVTKYQDVYNGCNSIINANMDTMLALHKKECGCNWTPEEGIKFPKH